MDVIIRKLGCARIVFCKNCDVALNIAEGITPFCPKCGSTDSEENLRSMLHCIECDEPVVASEGGGYYCVKDGFYPSMQDIYFSAMKEIEVIVDQDEDLKKPFHDQIEEVYVKEVTKARYFAASNRKPSLDAYDS